MKSVHELIRDIGVIAVCGCIAWLITLTGTPILKLITDSDVLVRHSDQLIVAAGSDFDATTKALRTLAEHALPAVDGAAAVTQDVHQVTAKLANPPADLKGKKPLSFGDRLVRLIF